MGQKYHCGVDKNATRRATYFELYYRKCSHLIEHEWTQQLLIQKYTIQHKKNHEAFYLLKWRDIE